MKKITYFLTLSIFVSQYIFAQSFTIDQISSYPFPSELTASQTGNSIAWAMNEKGLRNIYVAQHPDFEATKITSFGQDDGQEITSLQFSRDSDWLVFVRGGEHGSNWNYDVGINPSQEPFIPKVEIWKVQVTGGGEQVLAIGDNPKLSPFDNTIAFFKNRQIWTIPLNGGKDSQLFEIKGGVSEFEWSPDGGKILFSVNRSSHALIGVYELESKAITYIEPSFSRDGMPKWSPNGQKIAFVRRSGGKGELHPVLEQRHVPWEIWVADINTCKGELRWKAPENLRGSLPTTHGGANLNWANDSTLVFLSYQDGWPHMYALNSKTGLPKQLTKGNYMVEHIRLSPDGSFLVFSANTGLEEEDIDRRHIGTVPVSGGEMELLTKGKGIEAIPVVLSDNDHIAFLSSTAQRSLLPAIFSRSSGEMSLIGQNLIPSEFPEQKLVEPKQIIFKTPDGYTVHGQIFEKEGGPEKKPAVLFVHGGPQRQMLLGWHYGDYYSNTYAVNQQLAEMGFVVLTVNFRLGIGYGYDFHKPARTYWQGAEEYIDIKAAGEYLARLPQVDPKRIGIYGGSYGGYLTALALAKDSDLFAAGVDIHGVHELSSRLRIPDGYEKVPDFDKAISTAWYSSPLAYLDTWRSPVLFIHGDDDRNVQVSQTTDLIRRFEEKKKPYEYLIIPDDSHHWMKHSNLIKVNKATVEFLNKHLNQK